MDARVSEGPRLAGWSPPPAKPVFRLGRIHDPQNPMPQIIQAAYEQPVVRQASPVGAFYVVGDPEGVKRVFLDNVANYPKTDMERRLFGAIFGNGLLSSEGDTWRSHRRTMAPPFAPLSVASYAPGMVRDVADFQTCWDQAPADEPVDVARDMTRLTLQIISRAVFSTDGAELGEVMERSIAGAMDATRIGLADFVPVLSGLRMAAREKRIAEVFAEFDGVVARLTTEREHSPGGADLLSRLIAARDAETGGGMTAQEVRDQVVTIFVAGHETTAAAMAWIWYLLAQHPLAEARLHAELDAVLGGRAPAAEDLPNLGYTRMVIEEAMRLYPPAPGTSTRIALQADEICGVKIPKGAMICVAPWVTHRHRLYWDRPEAFEPERFSKENAAGRSRFAYIPFGAGPRVCIGASLAMTEMLIVLATLAQRYRLALAPGHEVELFHQVTVRPKGGLPMIVSRR
ncbi:cytochrome P450 [Phenylobacterium sp.]|uniref:cytochrome P450 n=1 Tax=Phenylobacterium sp. TaxID=1871053 RepID=UPI0027360535|nr:cytochrome P450 [Phenylobacterium sp.]MDP3855930.1 cytochrome P450 [Phenylobacterium sp.]